MNSTLGSVVPLAMFGFQLLTTGPSYLTKCTLCTGANDSEQVEAPDALCSCIPACLPCLPQAGEESSVSATAGRGNQRLSGQFLGEPALPPSSPESNDGDPASAAGTSSCQEGIRQDEGGWCSWSTKSWKWIQSLQYSLHIFASHDTSKTQILLFFLQACQ